MKKFILATIYAFSALFCSAQNLTAHLATDNPAPSYIVYGQGTADLVHFAFVGKDTLTSIKLKRTGLSSNSVFTNVYLYGGYSQYSGWPAMVRLTGGYKFNDSGEIVIKNLHLPIDSYMVIFVKADVSADTSVGSTVEIKLTSYTYASSTKDVSVNIAGNMMYLGSATNMASATLVKSADVYVSDTTIKAGTTNYPVWSDTIKISKGPVFLRSINFLMEGSASIDAIQNLKLYVDDYLVSETSVGTNGYALFDLTGTGNPALFLQVGLHSLKVCGDVQKEFGKNFNFLFETSADLTIADQQTAINVQVSNLVSNGTAGLITIEDTGSSAIESLENQKIDLRVYPNPFMDSFNVKAAGQITADIYEMSGNKIFSYQGCDLLTIHRGALPIGEYVLKIITKEGIDFRKIIAN